jgi:hypothetical protein
MPEPSVFISYSHRDEDWKDCLVTHLGVLQQQGHFNLWTDREIGAGEDWLQKIQEAMDVASVAILLVSANSLTSEFILHEEMVRLLERRNREGLSIYPIIIKPCAWDGVAWLAHMQVCPREGRPLSAGSEYEIDAALTDCVELADRSQDADQSMLNRTTLAEALYQDGLSGDVELYPPGKRGSDSSPDRGQCRVTAFYPDHCHTRRALGISRRGRNMKHDPIVEEIHQIRQKILAECHGELDQLLDRLQTAETQDHSRVVSWEAFQSKRQSEPGRHLTRHRSGRPIT